MPITFIPRQKDALDTFTEGISPYLQFAFQKMLEQKFQDKQRQKAISELGIGKETLTPQGEQYLKSLPLSDSIYQGIPAGQQPLATVPAKYKEMTLDMEKAKQLPPGMEVPLAGGASYKVPQPQQNLFSNLTIDQDGEPAIKIGENLIKIRSLSKTGFTTNTPTEEERLLGAIAKGETPGIPKENLETLVEVTNPQGKRVKIKSSQLEEALRSGYKK